MAENVYQEEGATKIDFVMRNYKYANMAADMGQCRFGFATDLKAVCAKGDSGATVYKFLKDASGSSNTASTRILIADANGAASSHASLTFDGTTLKIAGALRKAGESVDNLTLGAAGLVSLKNKLMVGSLDEMPENQLVVYNAGETDTFIQVSNGVTGTITGDGLIVGLEADGDSVLRVDYMRYLKFQSGSGMGPKDMVTLRHASTTEVKVNGKLVVDGHLHVAGSSSLANVEAEDVSVDNLEVDDTFTAKLIKADWYNGHLPLYIKNATDDVYAKFETIDNVRTVTIADKLVVDGDAQVDGDLEVGGNLQVGGLTASQIVETDASKILISVAKRTAYNANFGTGSSDVCRGNDSRLSDARVPINNDYYVQGSSSSRTTDAGNTDVNSYSQSGFYRAISGAPNNPTGGGFGIIHTNFYTSDQHAFQIASRWDVNNLFYRRKSNGTWQPWVELYHTGNEARILNQDPIAGAITPDKYIIINCNGTDYKIPVVAA